MGSTKTGENNSSIWLSVMGQIYDVTKGEKHYGKGKSYAFFAGKDASASFVTGKFNKDGLKRDLTNVTKKEIMGIEDWRKFYAEEEKYPFVGVLTDGRFYDEDGNPTYLLKKWRMNIKKNKRENEKINKIILNCLF